MKKVKILWIAAGFGCASAVSTGCGGRVLPSSGEEPRDEGGGDTGGAGDGGGAGATGGAQGSGGAQGTGGAIPATGGRIDSVLSGECNQGFAPDEIIVPEYRLAQLLSEVLFAEAPDDGVVEAVNEVTTRRELRDLAHSMLADERAKSGIARFFPWYITSGHYRHVHNKDPDAFPAYTEATFESMIAEAQRYGAEVLDPNSDAAFSYLLTEGVAYPDVELAWIYEVRELPADPSVGIEVPDRGGIFSLPLFAAVGSGTLETSPIMRGVVLFEQLLCGDAPPPPPDVPGPLPERPADVTGRQYWTEILLEDPLCATCHRMFTPLGFGFEHLDAVGMHRATDAGQPIDVSINATLPSGDASFADANELLAYLSIQPSAWECMAQKWFEWLFGEYSYPDRVENYQPHLNDLVACSITPTGEFDPGLFVSYFVTSPLVVGSFACGDARCVGSHEMCFLSGSFPYCEPARANCDSFPGCLCLRDDSGNLTVDCSQ